MDTPSTSRVLRSTIDHEMSESDESYIPSSDNSTSDEEYESDNSNSSSSSSSEEDDEAAYIQARRWTYIPTNNIVNFPPPPPRFPFLGIPGLTQPIQGNLDPLFFFELFFTLEIIQLIVSETNNYASKMIGRGLLSPKSRSKSWEPITDDDLRLFIGVIILQGLVQKPKSEWYWTNKKLIETPAFTKMMPQRKFFLIMQYLHFSNNDAPETTPHPQPKLKKIWPILQYLTKRFSEIYIPNRDICIDESLMLFKGRLAWTQYIPLKRSRFGIKMFILCESSSGYVWSIIVYTGKGTPITNDFRDCKMSTKVVMTLMKPLLGLGYCVTLDNYYNSPELAELLLQQKTDFFGTVRPNRKDMPERNKKDRLKLKTGETIAHQKGKILALRWHDKKDVNLLSSVHSPEMVQVEKRGQQVNKPRVVIEYNNTMGGVDKMDQRLVCYPTARKRQRKYYKKLFAQLLDMAILNSHVLYTKCGGTKTNLDYRLNLVERICEMYCHAQQNNNHFQIRTHTEGNPLRLTARHFPSLVPSTQKTKNACRRCLVCASKKQRRESRYYCKDCNVALCVVPCFMVYHTVKNF